MGCVACKPVMIRRARPPRRLRLSCIAAQGQRSAGLRTRKRKSARSSGVRRSAEGDWLMMRLTLGFADEVAHIAVERAIAEFRTSRPVLIEDGAEAALTVAVEGLCPDLCAALDPVAGGRARLVCPRRGCGAWGLIALGQARSPCLSSMPSASRPWRSRPT